MARYVPNAAVAARLADVKHDLLERVAAAVERDAKRYVPVDTSALRRGIDAAEPDGDRVRVYTRRDVPGDDPNVPIYVEFGTRARVIEPDDREALAWPGGRHPVARVAHPGTPEQAYMRPALFTRRQVL